MEVDDSLNEAMDGEVRNELRAKLGLLPVHARGEPLRPGAQCLRITCERDRVIFALAVTGTAFRFLGFEQHPDEPTQVEAYLYALTQPIAKGPLMILTIGQPNVRVIAVDAIAVQASDAACLAPRSLARPPPRYAEARR